MTMRRREDAAAKGVLILGKWVCALAAGLTAVFSPVPAAAQFRFDDLFGPSGAGAQWMAVADEAMYTGGNAARDTPLDTVSNIVLGRSYVRIANGKGLPPLSPNGEGWNLHTLFLVLPGDNAQMQVRFRVRPEVSSDQTAVTPAVGADLPDYVLGESFSETFDENGKSERLYSLSFDKRLSAGSFGTSRGTFIFHQNPSGGLPSQTLQIPFVAANVYDGTAEGNPLRFLTTIRDNDFGDIAAHRRFGWNAVNDAIQGPDGDWVFVPLSRLPIGRDPVAYRLKTEVANYTGIRYALQRYDQLDVPDFDPPDRWAFDLPESEMKEHGVPLELDLDELSHIPPGLVTTYRHTFNAVTGAARTILYLYPVDPTQRLDGTGAGYRTLTLEHRSIFGLKLGSPVRGPVGGGKNVPLFNVTGFRLIPAEPEDDFLRKLGGAAMPEPEDGVTLGVESVSPASDVIAALNVDTRVPNRLEEGLLPLHVTFNLPRSNQIVNLRWDALLREWRATGDIRDIFAELFSVYFRDGGGKNLNLLEWLKQQTDKTLYARTVKVFLDEERELLTVSFVVLLADGGSSAVRVVEDATVATRHSYIAAWDGSADRKWSLQIFAAPAAYVPTDRETEDGGGGGCAAWAGFGVLSLLPLLLLQLKRGLSKP
jgi:hypothetical protein